ncbi:MAG: hypothetical protein KF894_33610 [Labilithrix sp.]|nr:hypothetical protein [Labilithrix sp.]
MNRWVMAAVVGLTVVGCAAGVEDPQPEPGPDPVQKVVGAQPFSGDLHEITEIDRLGVGNGMPAAPDVMNELPPPMPGQ